MVNCSFCGKALPMGTGFTLFKRDGTALHFDRRKCQKSQQMGRVPTKLKWTAKYGKNA